MPGAYEWWYFDAHSTDGQWALVCIWFLGCPFSPYYARSVQGQTSDPFKANAVFFALYNNGQLYAYHFTQFDGGVSAEDGLHFGPNALSLTNGLWQMSLSDENTNGRQLDAALTFTAPPLQGCTRAK